MRGFFISSTLFFQQFIIRVFHKRQDDHRHTEDDEGGTTPSVYVFCRDAVGHKTVSNKQQRDYWKEQSDHEPEVKYLIHKKMILVEDDVKNDGCDQDEDT